MKTLITSLLVFSLTSLAFAEENGEEKKEEANKVNEANTVKLDASVIVGTPEEIFSIPGSVHVLDEEDLKTLRYDDIHRTLSQVPGVYVREEDGYGLRPNIGFRGADTERSSKVVLMEDGVLFGPAPYSAPAAYYFPMVTRMTGLEVFKGPSAVMYGPNTVGGALNLSTREVPYEQQGGLDLALGTDGYGKALLHHGNKHGNWGYVFDIVHLRSDGFKELDNGGDTGFDKTEGMFKLQYETDPRASTYHLFELKLGYSDEVSNETYLGLREDDFDANPQRRYGVTQNDEMDWDRQQVVFTHQLSYGSSIDVQTDIYHQEFSRTWARMNGFRNGVAFLDVLNGFVPQSNRYYEVLNGTSNSDDLTVLDFANNERDFVSQGIQFNGAWDIGGDLEQMLKFGLRLHRDEVERNQSETGYASVDGDLVEVAGTTEFTSVNKGEAQAISSYLHHELTWKGFKITPGLRVEYVDLEFNRTEPSEFIGKRDDIYFLPGIGVSYDIDSNLVVFAGVHEGFSPITPNNEMNIGDAEESLNFEAGIRYHREATHVEVIGFFNDYSNITGDATFSTGATADELGSQFSGGEVDIWGAELVVKHEFENQYGLFPVSLNYTYTETEFKNTFESDFYGYPREGFNINQNLVVAGDSLPYVPEHLLQIGAGFERGKWSLNLSAKYISEMNERASDLFTEDFWNFDFAGTYTWNERFQSYLKVDNIFDKQVIVSRQPFGARPNRPLQAFVGTEVSW